MTDKFSEERDARRESPGAAGLSQHPFVKRATGQAVEIRMELEPEPWKVDGDEFMRLPTEWEFYAMGVGHALAHLLVCIEQLEHAVEFLSDFSYSERMRQKGIRRHHHLIYNIENFIIRTQILYDRILQLVDRVFHLLNEPRNCRHGVVTRNLKVARTQVPARLGPLRKLLQEYEEKRHSIVHREAYKEDELSSIERLYLVDELEDDGALAPFGMTRTDALRHMRSQLLKEVVREKRAEFLRFNTRVIELLSPLFDELDETYQYESNVLRVKP